MSAKSFKEATVGSKGYIFSEHRKRHLNKTKKKNTYHSVKAYSLGDHYQQELKSPLSDQNLLNKSTFKCENCKLRIT